MNRIREALRRLGAKVVATGDENEYYAWADARLDELALEARLAKRRSLGRMYQLTPTERRRTTGEEPATMENV